MSENTYFKDDYYPEFFCSIVFWPPGWGECDKERVADNSTDVEELKDVVPHTCSNNIRFNGESTKCSLY